MIPARLLPMLLRGRLGLAGAGDSSVIIDGPFCVCATDYYTAGARAASFYNAGPVATDHHNAGAVASQGECC